MFSKTTTSHYEKGNQKPSMIKKKARTTILNVLNKRQTQEKSLAQAERRSFSDQTSQLQSTRRTDQESPNAFPQTASPSHRESVPEKTMRTSEVTNDAGRYPNRGRGPDRQNSVSSLVRKWSADNLSPSATKPKAASFTSASLAKPVPKSVTVQQSCVTSSFPPSKKHDDDENRYSVVIQTSANYPPPLRRKSSADVTPHDVTVNAIRVYEATTKMVNADPELIASLDRYPSREPPVMSPTTVQRFTWERDMNTGVEQKTRAVVVKGKPLVQASQASTNTDSEMRPRLVSDSVQVSIPFGVPDTPTSDRSSGSDGWSSSVSVCVPFQITDNQVKPLPVRGGARPQSLPSSDGLAIEDLNELFDRSDEPGPGSLGYITNTVTHTMDPDSSAMDIPSSRNTSRSPTLVTVRRKPDDELVQKIIHFQDSTVCNETPDDVFDRQDGLSLSKRGHYSLADYNSTVHTEAKKNSPSLTRIQQQPESTTGSEKIRPRATLVNSQTPRSVTKDKTASLPAASKKDELDMLRARIKQLEAELELEKARHAPNDAILSSIPILEKEKLRLQSQVNEALQDLTKAKSQLRTATYTTNRLEAEKDVLETKYRKLEKDFEKLQNQNVELQFERDQLLREKKNRTNEDMDIDANLVTIQSLSQRNEELIHSQSELKERVCVLVKGLRDVKKSVEKVKEENNLLHEEIVDNGVAMAESMKKCLLGLQQVVEQFNNQSNNMIDNDEIKRLTEELADSKSCCSVLLQRVVELETNTDDNSPKNHDGCPNCAKLEEEIKELHMDYDELKEKHENLQEKMEEVSNDREDLFQETKYLKKVLSYRQDIMEVQVSEKTNRQLQRLETNLEEAEKKCKGLEDEVGLLYKQKQTLLENIMKLHDEEVAQQNAGGDDDEDDELSDDDEDDYSSDEQTTTTPSPSRSKTGSMKKSLYANISNEAEFSSGASFYGSDTESDSDSDQWSELEGSSTRLQDLVSGLKSDRKRLRSNLKELMQDKRSLNKRIDKSTQDFKSLMKRMEKLDSENTSLREKVKTERRALKSKLKKEEKESERLRENLKDMESEKAALMKCIEMNSAAANEVETNEPAEDLEDDDISRLIAKAQAFAQEEKETKLQGTIDEESQEEAESADEKDNGAEESGENEEAESEEKTSSSSEEEKEEEKKEVEKEDEPYKSRERAIPPPLFQKDIRSESEDEKDADKEEEERERYEMEDIMSPPPPPPHARLLQRRASTVGINMDRVNREKQHLEEEVASLKKYLNRSAYRRRYSTVETPKAPPLGAMKTLESLLQKSDMELKEANAKICHLQSMNADLEERLKDAEMNQDDLRRAVVIANNYAAEEREKNTALEEERDSLMQKLETLKRENSRLRKSRAINAVYRKGARGVKSLDGDMVDSDGPDGESDLSSVSRRSSNASDL